MPTKGTIQYDITPRSLDPGTRWVRLYLENVGEVDLKSLEVQVNSLDTYAIDVHGTGSYLDVLRPGEEKILPFQVTANARASVYVTLDGWKEEAPFHWESLPITLDAGQVVAEIASFFALTEPYVLLGEEITCELVVRSLGTTRNLVVEFWVETPDGTLLSIAKEGTEVLAAGEEERHEFTFTAEEQGLYILHAYLFDNRRRIDHAVEYVSISM